MHARINCSSTRGIALVLAILLLAVFTTLVVSYLIRSDSLGHFTRLHRDKKLSLIRGEVGLDYAQNMMQEFVREGMKKSFATMTAEDVIIPSDEGGEYEMAVQVYEGGVYGDPYGLDDSDVLDVLFLFNAFQFYDPLALEPNTDYQWRKFSVEGLGPTARDQEYLYFHYATQDRPEVGRFALASLIAPGPGVTQSASGIITIPYRYVVVARGYGKGSKQPQIMDETKLYTLLDAPLTDINRSVDLSKFQATNYDMVLQCLDSESISSVYGENEGSVFRRGQFEVKLFAAEHLVSGKTSDFLSQYPISGNLGPWATQVLYDAKYSRLIVLDFEGLSLVDRETGTNNQFSLHPTVSLRPLISDGMVICGANRNRVCVPMARNYCGTTGTCLVTDDFIIAKVDPSEVASNSFKLMLTDANRWTDPRYPEVSNAEWLLGVRGRYAASKGEYVAVTGKDVWIYNTETDTQNRVAPNSNPCDAIATSPDVSDNHLYAACGDSLYKIDPATLQVKAEIGLPFSRRASSVIGPDQRMYIIEANPNTACPAAGSCVDPNVKRLTTIDLANETVLSVIPLPFKFSGDITNNLSEDGTKLFIGARDDDGTAIFEWPGKKTLALALEIKNYFNNGNFHLYTYDLSGDTPAMEGDPLEIDYPNRQGFHAADGSFMAIDYDLPQEIPSNRTYVAGSYSRVVRILPPVSGMRGLCESALKLE